MPLYKPQILIANDESAFAHLAADTFLKMAAGQARPLVTLPTGMTPLGLYQLLVSEHAARRDLWDQMRFIALDEYAGLPPDDERLFGNWLARTCLDPLHISNRLMFNSLADPDSEAVRVEAWLKQNGPLDIAVLGIGGNGHVAFNEPGTSFAQGTHAVTLTPDTISANARYWGGPDRVPRHGITLGLQNLAAARQTLLLVHGAAKADILKRALSGPVTTDVPASYLQTVPHVTVIADRAAALSIA